ncbi:DUF397 domain-containing protein [Actinomadura craniellae]|uniref:DUF397 domain-containing protein n=1 Tax=Actinomadura craniellae TaxID=2231787 RepID=A0A365H7V9_9ACTN|nr:DUF397 domain-containing protein [Actinomadura craniellae]RAY15195.1 DUF397 domain-containing protein [Actinomadura craniellae]
MHIPELSSAAWRKSSRSGGNGNCIEVANLTTAIAIRDSKDPGGPTLTLPASAFATLITRLKHGDPLARP